MAEPADARARLMQVLRGILDKGENGVIERRALYKWIDAQGWYSKDVGTRARQDVVKLLSKGLILEAPLARMDLVFYKVTPEGESAVAADLLLHNLFPGQGHGVRPPRRRGRGRPRKVDTEPENRGEP